MSKSLSEQKVLKKLGIEDFRHLSKDKVIKMASMLDKMDPDVAKKAIEQFPEFSKTMENIVKEYKATLDKALEENSESVKSFYTSADLILTTLQDELKKENLTFDEKRFIIEKMVEVQKMKGEKDSENKRFIAGIAVCATVALGAVAAVLSSTLGIETNIDVDDITNLPQA